MAVFNDFSRKCSLNTKSQLNSRWTFLEPFLLPDGARFLGSSGAEVGDNNVKRSRVDVLIIAGISHQNCSLSDCHLTASVLLYSRQHHILNPHCPHLQCPTTQHMPLRASRLYNHLDLNAPSPTSNSRPMPPPPTPQLLRRLWSVRH